MEHQKDNTKLANLVGALIAVGIGLFSSGCLEPVAQENKPAALPEIPVAKSFAYPIGNSETVTAKRDKDDWYNALDFGEQDHLGEDWNKNTGGNTDCGEPVYAAADGVITYAGQSGPGWGNVVIVEHRLSNGNRMQTLYGHLRQITKTSGVVRKREQIGNVGNANGRYFCHLHFELRSSDCRDWDRAGGGYSTDRSGWIDPSDFIDSHR